MCWSRPHLISELLSHYRAGCRQQDTQRHSGLMIAVPSQSSGRDALASLVRWGWSSSASRFVAGWRDCRWPIPLSNGLRPTRWMRRSSRACKSRLYAKRRGRCASRQFDPHIVPLTFVLTNVTRGAIAPSRSALTGRGENGDCTV